MNPVIDKDYQRKVTRICIKAALLLLQYGTESAIVVQMTQRLGKALGVSSVECALTSNAIILTTLANGNCITTVRKNEDRGINMQMAAEVQHIVFCAERKLYDAELVSQKLNKLKPIKYRSILVVPMIGLSCASFAHLSGGDFAIMLITFVAASIAMFIRQKLSKRHYNPIIIFAVTAFVASLVAGASLKYQFGNAPHIALASSVLLLVPGFPLINSLADILKGYINMGIARWVIATTLTLGTCLGIVFALGVLQINNWGA